MDNNIRVQMVIDGPDDLEQLQSPEGLKEAVIYAHQLYEKTKKIHVTSKAGTDLCYEIGEYPVMSQYGMADEPGRFDQWGVGHIHTFPNEGVHMELWSFSLEILLFYLIAGMSLTR